MASDTPATPDIAATLAQRGAAYGDFREQGRITQNLKRSMQDSPNWAALPAYMKEGLDMVQHKVSRILNGDALYDDNLHDIIGYTRLMQDRARQDREAGVVFVTPGDRLYPAFAHDDYAGDREENKGHLLTPLMPVDNGVEVTIPTLREQRAGSALVLATLSEMLNDGYFFTNQDTGTTVSVTVPPRNKEARDPAFLNDPVRAVMAGGGRVQAFSLEGTLKRVQGIVEHCERTGAAEAKLCLADINNLLNAAKGE